MPSKDLHASGFSTTRRRFLQASTAAVVGSTLSSCGWRLANVQSSPGPIPPTKMYIYTWANYTDEELLKNFSEQTGIEVIADVFESNEAMLAKIQTGGGGAYSIIYPSEYMVRKMIELDILRELDHSRLVGINHLFPRFQNPDYDPGNRHSVPISWGTTGLIYNPKKLQNPPQDWNYLWDNQQDLSRRLTLLNDVREVMGCALKSLGYSYNSTNPEHIKQAYEKLVALKPAVASFNSDAWRDQILAGDLLMAMCFSSDANEVISENSELKYVLPTSGSSLWIDTLVIPKFAPNVEGAYAWINFLMQPAVAAKICERLSFATPNQAAVNKLPEEVRDNVSLFPPESALEKCEGLAPVGEVTDLYERYWTKLTSG
ncbi:MAG: spermidine/putrescine ABC transporter substrate-binding protein [Microcoleus vaginatus WJT46-NPBG5]|nr:spermidine/putrescine ABC transporter substrate-binding protein [Microcoleus vaginatus WJT46-NPBG5]